MTESSVDPSSFRPFEVTAVHLIYVGLGFFIVLFGMFSLFIKERLYLGEAPLAAVFGIIVGPACLGLFNPSGWANNRSGAPGGLITDEISLEVLRVTIALSVFAVGVELPKKYLLRHWRSIVFLLGPVMIWGWLITAAFMYALIPGLDFLNSLVVASCVTPTDPILAQAVVGGPWAEKHVPAHLRHILMCESGCNDGAAFPFLYLALFLTTNRDNHGKAIAEWFYDAWAYQIIFGTLLGALIGWAARKLMRFSERHKLVDRESFVAQYVSLAIASMGVNVLLGSDDLLAAFACGTAFAWDGWFTKQTEDSNFSSIVDLLFNVAVFIYIGSLMPFRDWVGGTAEEPNTLSLWRLFVLAICVLLTKRIPVVLALWRWIPDIKTFREAVFAGHFGPIGVGAIFIATLARIELPQEVPSPPETSNDVLALVVQPVIYFFVICSIAVHGLTIPFFAFSKNATRMTRTWSRNPSFARDTEPNWVSRIRSKRTGDGLTEEEGNMTEIERVLNAQLRTIGRGAIGGDAEKELSRSVTQNGSGSGTSDSDDAVEKRTGISDAPHARIANDRDDEDQDGDAFENINSYDPQGDEWGGDDTVEMRRYKEKLRAKKESEYAELRQKQQSLDEESRRSRESGQRDHADSDIGAQKMLDEERGPMDRDIPPTKDEKRHEESQSHKHDKENKAQSKELKAVVNSSSSSTSSAQQERQHAKIREECEEHYPKSRSWVEGDTLVIEYQKSRLSEAECHTMPLMENERASIMSSDDPAHTWALQHADALSHYAGLDDARSWSPREAMHNLVHHGIPQRYAEALSRRRKRRPSDAESKEQRDARFQALYGGMEYASQRRHDDDDEDNDNFGSSNVEVASSLTRSKTDSVHTSIRSEKQRKEPKVPRQRTPSPPVVGWLAPQQAAPRRRPKNIRSNTSSPNRSTSPSSHRPGSTIRFAPREHKLASDKRRRSTTKKVLSGRVSLRPLASTLHGPMIKEEVIEAPKDATRRTGIGFERSSSAGGLGLPAPFSGGNKESPIRSFFSRNEGSSRGGVPRSETMSSTGSHHRSYSSRHPIADQFTSTQPQWLDEKDQGPDLARIGGGVSRPVSRRASPERRSTADTERDDHSTRRSVLGLPRTHSLDVSTDDHSENEGQSSHRHRHRISTLFSSITSHAHSSPSQRHPLRTERGRSTTTTTPSSVVTSQRRPADSTGGILTDGGGFGASEQSNGEGASLSYDDASQHASERGVTFNV